MFVLLFIACKKDEKQTIAKEGTKPTLTATASSLVLTEADSLKAALSFSSTTSSFGYDNNIVSYALQVDTAGNNFAAPQEVSLEGALTKAFIVKDFNAVVNQLKLRAGAEGTVEVRIKASISNNFTPAYSNVLSISVIPYLVDIVYPSLYVPGSYQGWAPATAARVSSVPDNGVYEGYINMPDAKTEFKFTPAPSWDASYGSGSAPGILDLGGGGNITINEPGYYLVKANVNAKTYSLTKTTWAVIGDATGSASTETAMTFSAATKLWTVTKALSAGTFKFRANGTDAINFGNNLVPDGKVKYDGVAIPVTEAGTYTITLNLSSPGNYKFILAKQ